MGPTVAYKYLPSSTIASLLLPLFRSKYSVFIFLSPVRTRNSVPQISPTRLENKNPSSFTASVLLHATPMTVKRTRTSNDAELEHSAPSKSPQNQTAVRLPSRIVTPPVQENLAESSNQSKLGGFLERCQYCRKRIPEGVEVFMYRDFCAYCSAGCRDIQISLDKLAERQVAFSQERQALFSQESVIQDLKNVKSHSGS